MPDTIKALILHAGSIIVWFGFNCWYGVVPDEKVGLVEPGAGVGGAAVVEPLVPHRIKVFADLTLNI